MNSKVEQVSAEELVTRLENGEKINIVDVREAEEVAHGMIADALHVPLAELEYWLEELPLEEEIVIVCRSGRRSMIASRFLIGKGYRNVRNLTGGMAAYRNHLKTRSKGDAC